MGDFLQKAPTPQKNFYGMRFRGRKMQALLLVFNLSCLSSLELTIKNPSLEYKKSRGL
jgi:hypothetical protein